MKKHLVSYFGAVLVGVFMITVTPNITHAEGVTYQPQTKGEMLAYLYGRIAQLMQIKQLVDRGKTLEQAVAEATVDYVTASTHRAVEITETTAVLRGEVNLFGKATAQAWFEYGEDEKFLDQRTNQVSIRSVYDRPVRVSLRALESDERYYFRIVVTDREGVVTYGSVYEFRTDELDEE